MERLSNIRIHTLCKSFPTMDTLVVVGVKVVNNHIIIVADNDTTYDLGVVSATNLVANTPVDSPCEKGGNVARSNVLATLLRGIDGKDGKTQDLSEYYKKSEVDGKLKQKQDTISNLDTIRTNAEKGATAVQPSELAKVATSGSYNDLSDTPTIPPTVTERTVSSWGFTKNKGTITEVKMNGVSKGTNGIVDLGTVITEHQDISGKQDEITDIDAIRRGAGKGDTSVQGVVVNNKLLTPDGRGNISLPKIPAEADIANMGFSKNKGTVTGVMVNGESKSPNSDGIVDLGTIEGGGGNVSFINNDSLQGLPFGYIGGYYRSYEFDGVSSEEVNLGYIDNYYFGAIAIAYDDRLYEGHIDELKGGGKLLGTVIVRVDDSYNLYVKQTAPKKTTFGWRIYTDKTLMPDSWVDLANYYTKSEVDTTLKTNLPYSVIPNKWCRYTDGVFVDTGSHLRCLKVEAKDIQWIGVRVYLSDSNPCAIAFFRQDGTYIIDASVQGRGTATSGEIFTAKVPSDAYYAYATTRVLEGFEPEVYTYNAAPFLIDEVTALNNAMSCNGYSLRSELFISGVIDANSGKVTEYKANSIVSSLIDVVKGCHYELRNATKYNIALFWYNDDDTYNTSSWYERRPEFTAMTNKVRIGLRLSDNSQFTVEYYKDFPMMVMVKPSSERDKNFAGITSIDTSILIDQKTYWNAYNGGDWLLPSRYVGRVCIPMQFSTGGTIRVSCNFDKCRCAVVQYDTEKQVADSYWLSATKEVAITGYAWYVQLMGVDYTPITSKDVELTIEVVTPLYPSYATAEQTYDNKRFLIDTKLPTIKNVTVGANPIPRLNKQDYAHLFIDKIYTNSQITIPHQSVFAVAAASKLGFEMMEFNTTFTSDGVPVVGHPVETNTLQILTDLYGNPVAVNVANITFEELRKNYRYNSIYPHYRVPINSLEEVLLVCREYNITPFIGNGGDARIKAIAHRIVGDGYVEYSGNIDSDMPLYTFYSNNNLEDIWTSIVGKNAIGIVGINDTLLNSLSDEEITEFKARLYSIGWRMAWAGCYCSAETDYRMRRLGLFANASRVDVPKFTDCDIHYYGNAVKGFGDFPGTFSVENNVAILNDGESIIKEINKDSIISKAQLSIVYNGTLQIVFGKKVITLASDGTNEVCLSSLMESTDGGTLRITSSGDTNVYGIDYRYASVI